MSLNLRNLDAPDAVTYLDDVKAYLEGDRASFSVFLEQLECLLQGDSSHPSFTQAVVTIAGILKGSPALFNGVNSLLRRGDRVECPNAIGDSEAQVTLFVLVTATSARILSASGCDDEEIPLGFPATAEELAGMLASKEAWKWLIGARGVGRVYLTCLSQLLQVLLDDDNLCANKVAAYRCLRELGELHSILPPSMFLNRIRRAGKEGLQAKQGGASSDIFMDNIKGTPICFRVLRMYDVPEEERKKLYKKFCTEVLVWRQLKHPNVLPLLGADTESFKPQFCFVSYWMNHGSIMAYLRKNPGHDRLSAVNDIVSGIDYLHHLDPPVTHNDLKGANILVTDELTCCLADFGLSSILESQRMGNKSRSFGGSVAWMAPEVMTSGDALMEGSGSGGAPAKVDMKAGDVYSLGCTIYEIYTGHPPHYECKHMANIICTVLIEKRRPEVPPATPPPNAWRVNIASANGWTAAELELWWLVERCWAHEPTARPTIRLVKDAVEELVQVDRRARGRGALVSAKHRRGESQRGPVPSKVLGEATFVDRATVEAVERVKASEWMRGQRGRGKGLTVKVPSGRDNSFKENIQAEEDMRRYPTPTTPSSQFSEHRFSAQKPRDAARPRTSKVMGSLSPPWTLARPPSPHPRVLALKSPQTTGLLTPPMTPSNSDFGCISSPLPGGAPEPLPPLPPTPVLNRGSNCPLDLDWDVPGWVKASNGPRKTAVTRVMRREDKPRRPAHLRYAVVIESDYEL